MSKRQTKSRTRTKDRQPRPIFKGRSPFKQGLRGVAGVFLGGLSADDESRTSVIGTSGNDAPDTDTSVNLDHYGPAPFPK